MANPAKKAFVRLEKMMACDLEPGDIFTLDLPDPEFYRREMNRTDVALVVMLRTNLDASDIEDKETICYKLLIDVSLTSDRAADLGKRIDPNSPPGLKKFI